MANTRLALAPWSHCPRDGAPRPGAGPDRWASAQHVVHFLGQGDAEAVEVLGHDDLAAEARSPRNAAGKVEHVCLILRRLCHLPVPRLIHDYMTRVRPGENQHRKWVVG